MADLINFDTMRIRLDFLFRTIAMMHYACEAEKMPQRDMEHINSMLATCALHLVYKHRLDERFQDSEAERVNARAFSQLCVDHFMTASKKIHDATVGIPITIRINREEMLTRHVIDDLIDILKGMLTPEVKEVSHG